MSSLIQPVFRVVLFQKKASGQRLISRLQVLYLATPKCKMQNHNHYLLKILANTGFYLQYEQIPCGQQLNFNEG